MRNHDKQTEFLKRCLRYDESAKCRELAREITRIQHEERYVQRAAWLMAVLTALAAAGLVYPAILLENFPYGVPPFIVNVICALGAGSLISLLAFVGLGMIYRKKLEQRREECRQRVARLLESRLSNPLAAPSREGSVSGANVGGAQAASGDHGSPAGFKSAARC